MDFQCVEIPKIIIGTIGYLFLLLTSGFLVKFIISLNSDKEEKPKTNKQALFIGNIIGRCENILILSFILVEAYTAIALVFAAKAIVRKEDIEKNSLYFLGGTMINVTYSVIIGFIVKLLLDNAAK